MRRKDEKCITLPSGNTLLYTEEDRCIFDISLGNFNAVLGTKKVDNNGYIGEHGVGIRGVTLIDFLAIRYYML